MQLLNPVWALALPAIYNQQYDLCKRTQFIPYSKVYFADGTSRRNLEGFVKEKSNAIETLRYFPRLMENFLDSIAGIYSFMP